MVPVCTPSVLGRVFCLFVCFCIYLFFLLIQTLRFIKNLFHNIRGEKQKRKKKTTRGDAFKTLSAYSAFVGWVNSEPGPRRGGRLAPGWLLSVGWFQALERPQHAWHLVSVSPGLCNSAHRYFGVLKYFSTFFHEAKCSRGLFLRRTAF